MIDVSAMFPDWSTATATLPDSDGMSTVTLRGPGVTQRIELRIHVPSMYNVLDKLRK